MRAPGDRSRAVDSARRSGILYASKVVALLLSDLGVTKTHSRPYTSTDNPYSEAQFRTMKYRPEFPDRFGCLQHARNFCGPFFGWYNTQHRHSGLAMLTPHDVHYGLAGERLASRAAVLAAAHAAHPERFPRGVPTPGTLPPAVWINKPARYACEQEREHPEGSHGDGITTPRAWTAPDPAALRSGDGQVLLNAH